MKYVYACPHEDSILFATPDVRNDNQLFSHDVELIRYEPQSPCPYPFVPAYLCNLEARHKELKAFFKEQLKGARNKPVLLVLPDDLTDLEAHGLSELLIDCGLKADVNMEYRAFLLSNESCYLAVTASKRAVTITRVIGGEETVERIFIPMPEVAEETVLHAMDELDSEGTMPIYCYDIPESLSHIGDTVADHIIVRNFVRML